MDKLLENVAISIYKKDDIENEMKDKISIVLNKKNLKKKRKKMDLLKENIHSLNY